MSFACSELGKGATGDTGNSLFRAPNVWWRCVQSFVIASYGYSCLETIDVCIWRMFIFMSVVVTVWGSVGKFVLQRPLLKTVVF